MDTPLPRGDGLRALAAIAAALVALGCSGDGGASDDGGLVVNGCPSWEEPLARPGDPLDGDTWETFASPFFQSYCTSCHHSSLAEGEPRTHAPLGFDFDQPDRVRAHSAAIRRAVGELNYMPPAEPMPSCEERRRLARWIDANLPGT